jgi:uncharacterized protein YciI
MLYLIRCVDKPGYSSVRAESRQRHLDYLAFYAERLRFAGPMLSEKDGSPCGSVLILDLADRGEAERCAAEDPYTRAGLFASVEITLIRQTLPAAGPA